jgi:nicotinate-nucleotide pyrophosphorylase
LLVFCQELSDVRIEVETRTLEEVQDVLNVLLAGNAPNVMRIMLDNMAR